MTKEERDKLVAILFSQLRKRKHPEELARIRDEEIKRVSKLNIPFRAKSILITKKIVSRLFPKDKLEDKFNEEELESIEDIINGIEVVEPSLKSRLLEREIQDKFFNRKLRIEEKIKSHKKEIETKKEQKKIQEKIDKEKSEKISNEIEKLKENILSEGDKISKQENKKALDSITDDALIKSASSTIKSIATKFGLLTMWVTIRDESVCEVCEELDGQITDKQPPEHANCRCTLTILKK